MDSPPEAGRLAHRHHIAVRAAGELLHLLAVRLDAQDVGGVRRLARDQPDHGGAVGGFERPRVVMHQRNRREDE
jgi:hypothetical protein